MNHPESRLHVVWLGHVVCIRSFQESRECTEEVDFRFTASQISRTAGGKPRCRIWDLIYSSISSCFLLILPLLIKDLLNLYLYQFELLSELLKLSYHTEEKIANKCLGLNEKVNSTF